MGILAVLGLCLGSFVNAFVWRLHEGKNWVSGRSQCVHCQHKLGFLDLIPLFSWLGLKGRCRYCKRVISVQYPIVELCTALLFVLSYIMWPVTITGAIVAVFGLWLVVATGLIALAVYDLKWMLLPTKVIYALLVVAVAMAAITIISSSSPVSTLISYLLATAIGGGLFYCLFQLSKGKWIGGGDVRLGFLLGSLVATAQKSLLLIFVAAMLGSLVSLPLMAKGKLKKTSLIPFGPFLILAAFIVELAGVNIIQWYSKTLLGF